MGLYEDIEKVIDDIEKERKQSKTNDETVKICVRIPKNMLMKLKMNKLIAEGNNKYISLQDQIVAALNNYLKIKK